MSEAWHQHLQNLTWWEQIDKFFFPDKYSCTSHYGETSFSILITITLIIIFSIIIYWRIVRHFERRWFVNRFKIPFESEVHMQKTVNPRLYDEVIFIVVDFDTRFISLTINAGFFTCSIVWLL